VVRRALGWRWAMIILFVGGLFATYSIFRLVPTAFVPDEDEGYFMSIVQAPAGASLEYTTEIAKQAEKILFADPDILAAFSVMGFSFTGAAPNNGMIFARLKDYGERPGPEHSLQAVLNRVRGQLFGIPGAIVMAFAPPALQGISLFGGFQFEVLDQTGNADINGLAAATFGLMGAGNQSGRVMGLFSSFRADDPQLLVDIDRDKARSLGLPLREVTDALQVFLGSQYVNDFDFNNRAYRVYVQADQSFRAGPADLKQLYARASSGEMISLDSVVRLRETTAPQVISHFNLFRSATLTGNPAPGQSSGQAIQAMEELARSTLPPGFDFAWSGQSLEEIKAGSQAGYIFGLSLVLVYLVLAAQYESWVLPFIILLGVPLAVLGALSAQLVRGFANDVFCQVGLVLLIGLAAKNSILIVEFAEQLRAKGLSIVDAAVESARIRLRPILMTSFAFILGVLPLALATGAGAAARNSVGTAVAGGMVASTFLSIIFIPVLYVVIRTLVPGRAHRAHDIDEAEADGAGGAGGTGRLGPAGATGAVSLLLALWLPSGAHAQPAAAQSMPSMDFDAAIARAIERNPTVAIASTNILRSEGILQQVRSTTLPQAGFAFTNSTLDAGRSFDEFTVQPQNQSLFAANVTVPVLQAAGWAARNQAADQVEISRLAVVDVRRQIAVSAAQAYLNVINLKRQVEVQLRALETAQAQFDYNQKRVQGGVGTRLNELRSAQEVATNEARLEVFRLAVRRAQEALGVLLAEPGPVDTTVEPAFEIPPPAPETEWFAARPDLRLFGADAEAARRVVRDSSKDWWPTANVSFDPQYITPGSIFQPSGSWRLTLQVAQPLYDSGSRQGVRRQREAALESAQLVLTESQIQARSEERLARETIASQERSLASARRAAEHANEVLKITIIAFDAGASTNIEVVDAQRSARDLETAVTQVEDAVRQARLDLLVALGRFPK
jgi:outer membrane protein TolC